MELKLDLDLDFPSPPHLPPHRFPPPPLEVLEVEELEVSIHRHLPPFHHHRHRHLPPQLPPPPLSPLPPPHHLPPPLLEVELELELKNRLGLLIVPREVLLL